MHAACAQKPSTRAKDEGYHIQGKVEHPQADGWIKLQEIENNQLTTLDSTHADTKGNFEFTGKVDEPSFHVLSFNDQQVVTVILENGERLEITAAGDDPQGDFNITGSRENDRLQEMSTLQRGLETKVQALQQRMQSASSPEQQAAVMADYEKLQGEAATEMKARLDTMGASLASLLALNVLNPEESEEDFKRFETLAQQFQKERPNSTYTKQLTESVDQLRQARAASVQIGDDAPDLTFDTPEGGSISLSSLRGKYVLIDFWASWCKPCRQENPNVVRLYNEYQNKNFEILGVSLDENKDRWVKAIEQDGLIWKHISDLQGWQSAAAEKYNVRAIPATFLVDPAGKVIAKNLRGPSLRKKLEELLGKS